MDNFWLLFSCSLGACFITNFPSLLLPSSSIIVWWASLWLQEQLWLFSVYDRPFWYPSLEYPHTLMALWAVTSNLRRVFKSYEWYSISQSNSWIEEQYSSAPTKCSAWRDRCSVQNSTKYFSHWAIVRSLIWALRNSLSMEERKDV